VVGGLGYPSGDPLAQRVWPRVRHRDWLYLAALLHALPSDAVGAVCRRLGLPAEGAATIQLLVSEHGRLAQVATQRNLQDEDLILALAERVGTLPRLAMLYALAVAEGRTRGGGNWTPWVDDLLAELHGRLERALQEPGPAPRGRGRSPGSRAVRAELRSLRGQVVAALRAAGRPDLEPRVALLPHRFLLARSPAQVVRHLVLAGAELPDPHTVRLEALPHRLAGAWELLLVARDRSGLLATIAGVLALRGITVLAADAATCSDGLVLDVFTVASAYREPLSVELWPRVAGDLRAALEGRPALADLLAHGGAAPSGQVTVRVDNKASQFYSVVEVRAPDRVGLLFSIALGLAELNLDIHHARIATHPAGVIDIFYVRDLASGKLDAARAAAAASGLAERLGGRALVEDD
jgi:[protein-PII] uridylyltransferase